MHPDASKILKMLRDLPAFRAQELAASHAGVSVKTRISRGLFEAEDILNDMGQLFFQKNPKLERAPYAFFLLYNVQTCTHDVSVQVGNAGITAMKGRALVQIVGGILKRVIT